MSEIIVSPPEPHGKKQRLVMSFLQMPGVEEMYVANGTKWGKTLAGVGGWCCAAVMQPRSHWRVVAPIYSQAQISLDYARNILPKDKHVTQVRPSKNEILIPSADVRLQFCHAQDPYSLEGAAVNGYLLDEAAKMPQQIYASMRTTVTRTKGPRLFTSTPLGKNWYYHKCMQAKEEMEWALKKGVRPTKFFITAPTSDNPHIDKAVIAAAKRELPERLFRQFYLAEFVDDGTVFSRFREATFGPPLEVNGEHLMWLDEHCSERNVVIGVDWAKTMDWTVFFAIDYEHRRVVGYERFHKRPYTEAVRRLGSFGKRFNDVSHALHDKTGVGIAIDEMCQSLPFPVTGVTFTNQSKSEMVNRLISRFELKDLAIPNWGVLLSELDSFEARSNAIGTLSYSAPDGQHDDTVCALFLANAALVSAEDSYDVTFAGDELQKSQNPSALEEFYDDLMDDD